jgi:hypothetical protein
MKAIVTDAMTNSMARTLRHSHGYMTQPGSAIVFAVRDYLFTIKSDF